MLVSDWANRWVEERYVRGTFGSRRASPATKAKVEQHLRDWILPVVGGLEIERLSRSDCMNVLAALAERSPATRNRVRTTLQALVGDAVIEGLLDASPAVAVRKHREAADPKTTLTLEERDAMLAELPDTPNGRAIVVLALTGMRAAEVINLTWDEVHAGEFHLGGARTKERRAKVVAFGVRAAEALGPRGVGPVFPGAHERTLRRVLARACADAGVPAVCPHGLRHTWAHLAEHTGATIRQIQSQLGHARIATTERYVSSRAPGVADVVRAVEAAAIA